MAHDEFIHPIGADGTTDDNCPPLLDDWQIQGVISFLCILVQKAHEGEQPLPVTPLAEMITTYGPLADPRGQVAYDGAIHVCVTLQGGNPTAMGFWELSTILSSQPQLIRKVEPLASSLTFMLHVYGRLLAWDVRSVVSEMAGDLAIQEDLLKALGVLTCGPAEARIRRREQFYARAAAERAQVLRDAVSSEILAPGRKRVPLRGLLHAGLHAFDSGETRKPFRLFTYVDAELRRGRKAPLPTQDVSSATRSAAADEYLQSLIATLPAKEAQAMQLSLQAQHEDRDLKDLCNRYGHKYRTIHQALQRAIKRLRHTP
jgi:hypothetical protein